VLDLDPATGRDPLDDLRVINAELAAYSAELAARPQLVVANKADLVEGDPDAAAALERIRRHCAATGQALHTISAATGRGVAELLRAVSARLNDLGWARAAS
jgi:GTP-binding protein